MVRGQQDPCEGPGTRRQIEQWVMRHQVAPLRFDQPGSVGVYSYRIKDRLKRIGANRGIEVDSPRPQCLFQPGRASMQDR